MDWLSRLLVFLTAGDPTRRSEVRGRRSGRDIRATCRAFLSSEDLRPGGFLERGDYAGADFASMDLESARLDAADLSGANLRGVRLVRARLVGARLRDADLRGADLREADLRAADLSGADLREARLSLARLAGVRCDAATRWPAGFAPSEHAIVLQE